MSWLRKGLTIVWWPLGNIFTTVFTVYPHFANFRVSCAFFKKEIGLEIYQRLNPLMLGNDENSREFYGRQLNWKQQRGANCKSKERLSANTKFWSSAQQRKNNKGTTKVEQSRKYIFWAATDNVRFIKWIFFLTLWCIGRYFHILVWKYPTQLFNFWKFYESKRGRISGGWKLSLQPEAEENIFLILFVSYDLYIKGNAGPFSVRGFLLSQSICSLTHWSTKSILMKKGK